MSLRSTLSRSTLSRVPRGDAPLSREPLSRTTHLAAAVVVALALSACGSSPGEDAPEPVKALPAPVQSLAVGTDVGQFFVTPKPGTPKADVDATVAKLKSMDGIQSVVVKDGVIDLQFRPTVTPEQREEALRQLAALGEVQEGI